MFLEYAYGVGVDFRLPHHFHPSALEAEVEASDAGEQAPDLELHSLHHFCPHTLEGW